MLGFTNYPVWMSFVPGAILALIIIVSAFFANHAKRH